MAEASKIAIIGVSGRYAKADNVGKLWEHLALGTDLTEDVSRWDLKKCFDDGQEPINCCPRGSFLSDIDRFDPKFFDISGTEATYMDPQQRLFLEEAWKALEDAGHVGSEVEGSSCGVFVGCTTGDYPRLFRGKIPPQAYWATCVAVIPARISYYLNLRGPAVAVDTACSSSLVAIHLACQSLRNRETSMAVAGGVFLQCSPAFYSWGCCVGMSPTGYCHTFDEQADGFVPGEGVGVVVLKRLNDALAHGDHIYGVIRGSGVNQDGATNGITAPSAASQAMLQREVFETFQIHPEEIQMVEAHGTGTKLGDPIECRALTEAFCSKTDKRAYCAIGSIKTNLGHTITAAGVTGVLKVLLS